MKSKCQIFGILNVTPDSFSDGGEFLNTTKALTHAEEMFAQGASFIDVGGQSTRPGAAEISWQEEWERIESVLKKLLRQSPERISLDTFHPETARKFLELGGRILNDVSGFQSEIMKGLAVTFEPIVMVNHFPGKTIDEVHEQKMCSMDKVRDELLSRKEELVKLGVDPNKIILDPGIGFGKTMELNWELLKFPSLVPNEKVMIGHSRKRFLGEDRFEVDRNLQAAQIAIESGASYVRVHDVLSHQRLIS